MKTVNMFISEWNSLLDDVSGDIDRMPHVIRYSSIPVINKENIIEHQGWVTLYSIMIHNLLRPLDGVLIGPICTHAISHDIAESITGDIVRTFKYSNNNLRKAINEAEENIIESFPDSIKKVINSHKEQLTIMGLTHELEYVETVIKMADFLCVFKFLTKEINQGNRLSIPFFKVLTKALNDHRNVNRLEGCEFANGIISFYETLHRASLQIEEELDHAKSY